MGDSVVLHEHGPLVQATRLVGYVMKGWLSGGNEAALCLALKMWVEQDTDPCSDLGDSGLHVSAAPLLQGAGALPAADGSMCRLH